MRHRPAVRLVGALAAAVVGLLASLLAAGPALAGSGPGGGAGPGGSYGGGGSTSCAGQSCYANVWQFVHLSGSPTSRRSRLIKMTTAGTGMARWTT
jgi:hypothetical protein